MLLEDGRLIRAEDIRSAEIPSNLVLILDLVSTE